MPRHRTLGPLAALAVAGLFLAACAGGATPKPTSGPPTGRTPMPAPSLSPGSPSPSASAATVDEIACDLGGHDGSYHIHSLVGVRVNGQLYAPPANIGIGTTCMYWVHTHATDGIVHIEAPAEVHPTLGTFLDLWAATYPDDDLLTSAREAIAAGEVTVDDQPYPGDALGLVLADKMRIFLGN
jgi:hypothetical protein